MVCANDILTMKLTIFGKYAMYRKIGDENRPKSRNTKSVFCGVFTDAFDGIVDTLTVHVQHHTFADRRGYSVAGDAQVSAHLAPRYFRQSQRFAFCNGYCDMQVQGTVSEVSSLRVIKAHKPIAGAA
jgi:hypothetical protein